MERTKGGHKTLKEVLKRKESDVLGIPKSLVIWASHPTILSLMSIPKRELTDTKKKVGYIDETSFKRLQK